MIDARGLSCPMPMVMTRRAIEKDHPGTLEVLVDNEIAVQNLTRLAELGWQVTIREDTEIPAGQILPELE